MTEVAEAVGHACVSVRHIFDPDIVVLGGGVMEACGDFIMPVVNNNISKDKLFGDMKSFFVKKSLLEDDAVLLGAVALVQQSLGLNPFRNNLYPKMNYRNNRIYLNNELSPNQMYVRADAKIRGSHRSFR